MDGISISWQPLLSWDSPSSLQSRCCRNAKGNPAASRRGVAGSYLIETASAASSTIIPKTIGQKTQPDTSRLKALKPLKMSIAHLLQPFVGYVVTRVGPFGFCDRSAQRSGTSLSKRGGRQEIAPANSRSGLQRVGSA